MTRALRLAFLSLFLLGLVRLATAQQVTLIPITPQLDRPVAITHAGDNRLFITLQRGQVLMFDGTSILPTPFLDIRSLVTCCGEQGLLSIAFHPRFHENGLFYAYYINLNREIAVARFSVSSDPDRADPASRTTLLTIPHSEFSNHDGGQLQFGPDGFLYIGVGDGGGAGDPHNHAQDRKQLLGKLLRIDVDSGSPYAIPSSNPFVPNANSGERGEIWAYGLRNPWRFSFDRETGDLWIGDVGQDRYEEVDLQPAGDIGGENYGWRIREGIHCFNPTTNCAGFVFTDPVIEYSHAEGCSIIGGYRYRGTQIPALRGRYLFSDYCSGTIWAATQLPNGAWTAPTLQRTTMKVTTFGEDFVGELYVVDGGTGIVYKIAPRPVPRRRAVTK